MLSCEKESFFTHISPFDDINETVTNIFGGMVLNRQEIFKIGAQLLFFLLLFPALFIIPVGNRFESAQTLSDQQEMTVPVFSVETEKKAVALTFDAAWEGEEIPRLLKILEDADVKATFFVVGDYVKENPEVMKAIAKAGHEIANHSDAHPHVCSLSEEEIQKDLFACEKRLRELGIKILPYYRAPYGEFDTHVVQAVANAGYLYVQWSVDSLDWKGPSAEEMTNRVLKRTTSGDILLFHTGKENTLEALPGILSGLKQMGLEILPVGSLLLPEPFRIDHAGRMFPAA